MGFEPGMSWLESQSFTTSPPVAYEILGTIFSIKTEPFSVDEQLGPPRYERVVGGA